jgi:dTDP-4-amino-4,6-dideoxygalactose transaminase
MDSAHRREVLERGRPGPFWRGEPLLGGYYGEEEIEVVERTIRASMDPAVGFGFICPEIEEFEQAFAAYCGAADCVSVNGAGTGLDMTMMCLDLQPGDEVIVPAINFRAAAMAVIGQRGQVILGEVDPRTFNLDPNHVETLMSPRTRAIFPVHMNGLAAPMDDYEEIAQRHPHPHYGPPKVIDDAARSCGAGYKGDRVGKRGWMSVFSFHTQKLMSTLGEGGAVTISDPAVAKRLRSIRQFGGADSWGTNYKLTKVQAAVGMVQLRKLDTMLAQRRAVAAQRTALLEGLPGFTLPYAPPECDHTYYLYTLLAPPEWAGETRDRLLTLLRERYEVNTVVANPPQNSLFPFIAAHTQGQCVPRSEELGRRLFCVPMHPTMTPEDNEYICAALWDAVECVAAGEA